MGICIKFIQEGLPKFISAFFEKIINIDRHVYYFGRDETSDLFIKDHLINYKHAFIVTNKGNCFLFDNNSINGTYNNGQRTISRAEYLLNSGDLITLANEKFVFKY